MGIGVAIARRRLVALVAVALGLVAAPAARGSASLERPRPASRSISFLENGGQAEAKVLFLARARGRTLQFSRDEVVFGSRPGPGANSRPLRMKFVGGTPSVEVRGVDPLPGQTYFSPAGSTGRPPGHPSFARLEYAGVYPGVDVVYYGTEDQLEFDLEIAPGADPSAATLSLDGAIGLSVAPGGDLTFRVEDEPVTLRRPLVYQERGGVRTPVTAAYVLAGPDRVAFSLGAYDRSRPLVLDPVFTFISAGDDVVRGLEVNAAGQLFVLGETSDATGLPWDIRQTGSQPTQCYLSKMDPTAATPLYTILFAGTTTCTALAVSPSGVAYFPGYEFPVTPGLQATTLLSVDDSSGAPMVGRVQVNNYNPFRNQVGAIAADVYDNVYLLGNCRVVLPGQPHLTLLGFNAAPDAGSGHPVCQAGSQDEPVLLTKVARNGAVTYATFLAPDDSQDVRGAGLAVDDQERVFVVRPKSAAVPVTPFGFRETCLDPECGYLMVIDTSSGGGDLLYAAYLWQMDTGEKQVARLSPLGDSLYLASVGRVDLGFPATPLSPYPDFPGRRDPNTGLPAEEGLQLVRFDLDGSGAPRILHYGRVVKANPSSDAREHLADLRIHPSGAAVVGVLNDTPDPSGPGRRFDGIWLTYYRSGVLALGVSTGGFTMFPSSSGAEPAYALGVTPAGELVTAFESQNAPWDIQVEVRADSSDPGPNTPPTILVNPLAPTVETYDPRGAIVQGYMAAFDWDEYLAQGVGISLDCPQIYNITRFPLGTTHGVCTATDGDGVTVTQAYDVTVNLAINTTAANVPISLVDVTGPVSNVHTPGIVTATFLGTVDANGPGLTWLRTRTDQKPIAPPAGLQLGSSPFYYEIGTTAVTTGAVELCFDFTGMTFAAPSGVHLYHLAGPAWADTSAAFDLATHRVCTVAADANELGAFAFFTPADERTRVEVLAGIGTYPGNWPTGFVSPGDGGPATAAALYAPNAVAFDMPRHAMYIADGNQVRRVDLQTGIITRYAGRDPFTSGTGWNPVEGGLATDTAFLSIDDVAVDRDGNVFLADGQSCVIQRIDRVTGILRNVAGAWMVDQASSCGNTGDGGEARSARISLAQRIAFDADGNLLFIQNSGMPQQVTTGTPGFIRRIAAGADNLIKGRPQETISTIAGSGQLTPVPGSPLGSGMAPHALALGRRGELYIASYDKILRIVPTTPGAPLVGGPGEVLQVVAGGDPVAHLPFGGDQGSPLDADLLLVNDVEVLPGGELLLTHANTSRVRLVTPGADGAVDGSPDEGITTLAGFEDIQIGPGLDFSGYAAAGDYALSTLFFLPTSATLDPRGGIVVTGQNYVRRFGYAPSSLTLSPAALDFGPQALGTTGAPRTVTVTNPTPNPLSVTTVTSTGDFTWASACAALAPGASCTIDVFFAPGAVGPRPGELLVTDSTQAVHHVALSGVGKGTPAVSLAPSSLTFASQLVGTTSPAQTVTLTNTGNDDLTITGISIASADFALISACPTVLGPGGACTIDVMSRPTTDSVHTGQLRVTSDAPGPSPIVTLFGYGDTRILTVSPGVVDFGPVRLGTTTPSSTVTLRNTGTTPLTLGSIQVMGSSATAGYIDTFAGTGLSMWPRDGYRASEEPIGRPYALAVDPRGNVFFAIDGGWVVRVDAATRLLKTLWKAGDPSSLVGPFGNHVPLGQPVAIAVDRAGNVYVAEGASFNEGGRVRRISAATGAIDLVAGNGLPGSNGNGGPAIAAAMSPVGVAVDAAGNLFIADSPVNVPGFVPPTVRRVDADTGIITVVAGGGTQTSYPPDLPAASAQLGPLKGVAVDAAGSVFVWQMFSGVSAIFKVDVASGTIAPLAGSSPATSNGRFPFAVDAAGRLYVSDGAVVRRLDGSVPGSFTSVAGTPSFGNSSGDGGPALSARFVSADAIALDLAGNLYLADGGASRIRRVDAFSSATANLFTATDDCGTPRTLGLNAFCTVTVSFASSVPGPQRAEVLIQHDGTDTPSRIALAGTGAQPLGLVAPASVKFPRTPLGTTSARTVVVTNSGDAALSIGGFEILTTYFALAGHDCPPNLAPGASCRAQLVFTPPSVSQILGTLRVTYGAPGSPLDIPVTGEGIPPALTVMPSALDFGLTALGTTATQSVTVHGMDPAAVSSLAVTGANAGDFQASGCTSLTPGPGGWSCTLTVAFEPSDQGTRIARLDISDNQGGAPVPVSLAGTGTLQVPQRLFVSPLALDFGRIAAGATEHRTIHLQVLSGLPVTISQLSIEGAAASAGRLSTLAGDGGPGATPNGTPAENAHLGDIADVAVDAAGNQYLADASGHRVWRIDGVTGAINVVAGTGLAGYGGDGGPASSATLDTPTSVAVDASGRIYISDTGNHRIRRVEPWMSNAATPPNIVTVAGNGVAGYSGDNGNPVLASLHAPQGLAIDSQGNVFVAETLSHVIRRIGADGIISTVMGDGTPGNDIGCPGCPPLRLNAPVDVALGPDGEFVIADSGNARVIWVDRPGGPDPHFLGWTSGPGGPFTPGGVAVSPLGRIFVSAPTTHRVFAFDPLGNSGTGGLPDVFAGDGTSGWVDRPSALQGRLSQPRGLAVDAAGHLLIADAGNRRLRRVDGPSTTMQTEFSADANCVRTLDQNESCDIDLTFTPTFAGVHVARLAITHDGTGPQAVDLTGFGTQPAAYVGWPATFYGIEIGTSVTHSTRLANGGNGPMHVSNLSVTAGLAAPDPFSSSWDCPPELPAGSGCTITITFTPTTVGDGNGSIQFTHDGPPAPRVYGFATRSIPARTQTTLTSSSAAGHSVFGEPVTFSVAVTSPFGTPGATASFQDDGSSTALLPDVTLSAGAGSDTTALLTAGTHVLQAFYGGDTIHAASASSLLTHTVAKQPTSTSLSANALSLVYGQSVLLSAAVLSPTGGPITGSVLFRDDVTPFEPPAKLTAGSANQPALPAAGSHRYTARYLGDLNSEESTSNQVTVTVAKAPTTTTLVSDSSPGYVNFPIRLTATVTPSLGGAVGGTVTFRSGPSTVLAVVPVAGNQAVLVRTFTSVQTSSITALYSGDGNLLASTSAPITQQVQRVPTTLTVTAAPSPSYVGQAVTFTVSVASPKGPPPDGQQVILYGLTPTPTVLNLVGGSASYGTSSLTVGGHFALASYAGNTTFLGNVGFAPHSVLKFTPVITVVSNPSPSTYGQPVTFEVTVSSPGGPPPDGAGVTLSVQGVNHPPLTLSGGVARFTTAATALLAGNHTVSASYSGDARLAFASFSTSHVVSPAPTTTTVMSSSNPSNFGARVTFTAVVASAAPGLVPTGSVTFRRGTVPLGTVALNATGRATYQTTPTQLPRGNWPITATYNPNPPNFATSTGSLTQRVQ